MALNTTNLTMSDVANYLKYSPSNIKLRELWSTANSPWSKMKPMDIETPALTTTIAKANHYGIELVSANNPVDLYLGLRLLTSTNNIRLGYDLAFPATSGSKNARLGDFRGFETGCPVPIANLYDENSVIDLSALPETADKSYQTSVESLDVPPTSLNSISRDDIFDGTTFNGVEYKPYSYLNRGVLFYKTETDYVWSVGSIPNAYCDSYRNGLNVIDVSDWELVPRGSLEGVNDYWVIEFVTNIPANTFSNNYVLKSTDIFYAVPYAAHRATLTSSATVIPVKELKVESLKAIGFEGLKGSYEFNIKYTGDSTSSSYIISDLKIELYDATNSLLGTHAYSETYTVSSTSTPSFSGTIYNPGVNDGSKFVISWKDSNNISYSESIYLIVSSQESSSAPEIVATNRMFAVNTTDHTGVYQFSLEVLWDDGTTDDVLKYSCENIKVALYNPDENLVPVILGENDHNSALVSQSSPAAISGRFTALGITKNSYIVITYTFNGISYQYKVLNSNS